MKFIFLARYLYFNEITILAHLTNAEWSGPLSPLDYLVYRMFTISSNCYWVLDKKSHMYVFIIPTKCVAAYKYLERGGKFYSRVLSKHMYENIDKVWWQALKLSRKSGLDNESYAVFFKNFITLWITGLNLKCRKSDHNSISCWLWISLDDSRIAVTVTYKEGLCVHTHCYGRRLAVVPKIK